MPTCWASREGKPRYKNMISEPVCTRSTATQNEGVTSARLEGFSEPFENFSDKRLSDGMSRD
jgi:hypothetical protein